PALERVAIAALLIVLAVGIWDLQRSRPVKKPQAPAQVAGASQTRDTTQNRAPASTPPPASTSSTTPVSDNGSLATYTTGRDRFAVMMQATDAPCWIQVRAGASGPVLFEGTLQPGEARPFDATRALWVRLGNLGHASVPVERGISNGGSRASLTQCGRTEACGSHGPNVPRASPPTSTRTACATSGSPTGSSTTRCAP